MNSIVDISATEQRIAERLDPKLANALAISDRAGGLQFANAGQAMDFAKMLAISKAGVRKHLRGDVGACLAIVVQSIEWGLSPYAVANKSYFVNDQIAFESQLIQAVILKRAPIKGRIKFEYVGEGQGRRCIASARLRDDPDEIVEYQSPAIKDIKVKNSPLWVADPDQQLAYYSGRALCRRHFPDILLGIFADDEVSPSGPDQARDVTPKSLNGRLDALSEMPQREAARATADHDPETDEVHEEVSATAADGSVDIDVQDGDATSDAPRADPEKIAFLEKARLKATQGTKKLRLFLGTISKAEEALLADSDRRALEAIAEEADARAD